ncbi:MAG: hypothetical protein IPM79_05455 [Polyangiaceae bacterium]|jgi:hypothetical protein|nr:hypothetical protein [Polyangiaceae bacterium]MBK8937088.1 hypothetical protein [Polyangiaceae bacterium]
MAERPPPRRRPLARARRLAPALACAIGAVTWSSTLWAQEGTAGGELKGAVGAPAAPPAGPSPAAVATSDPALEADRARVRVASTPTPATDDLPAWVEQPASDGFVDRFILESARAPFAPLNDDFLAFSLHGEYQARFRAMTDLPLEAPVRGSLPTSDGSEPLDPGLLGQNAYLYHWLRLNGRIAFRDDIIGYAQIDVPRGMIVGQKTQFVERSRDALNDFNWYDVHPRDLFVEFRSPIGVFRVGQQTSHWGQGILANDGNHPTMFGDTIRGAIVERLLFATSPMGKGTPLLVVVAGDFVFEDNTADVLGNSPDQPTGDLAGQAVAAIVWREDWAELGMYGVYRHQQRELTSGVNPYEESLDVGVIDLAGKIRGKVPGASAYAYAHGEAALVFGRTSYLRTSYVNQLDPTAELADEGVLTFGASTTFGFVHVKQNDKERWGDLVAELEWGYASGDADPLDGQTRRFTFDTSHNVGLVLFDHVLGWKTARAATIAQDPRIVARPSAGLQLLPSNGGVFGATFLNPRVIFRPVRMLDVKLGLLWAQATADVVDPYHVGALGDYRNYDGGDPTSRDLGVEIDVGADVRIPLERTVALEIGAEGGVLFPGHAFDDDAGRALPEQLLVNTKLGLQF